MIITILLILILIVLGYHYYTHYGRNGRLINCIPGPQGHPISGNILQYLGSRGKLKFFYRFLNLHKLNYIFFM